MPNENIQFLPQPKILTFEEIVRFTSICAKHGVNKIRITGGEPLVRKELPKLIRMLVDIPGIADVAITTNGVLLADQVQELRDSGLHRLNISLDTLQEEVFQRITRRSGIQKVLDGIDAAIETGFEKIRLNSIAMASLTESEIVPLAEFARQKNLELRFIEFMPLDAEQNWEADQVLTGEQIRETIEQEIGKLEPVEREDVSQPAVDFAYQDGQGRVGFINPISQPFCETCNRLRITAEGKIRNCLFSTTEFDAMQLLRNDGTDEEISQLIFDCVDAKKAAHGIDSNEFQRPEKAMYQIGG